MCRLRSKKRPVNDLKVWKRKPRSALPSPVLVNLKAIREIKLLENGLAEMITHAGHKVPVSRRYLKELKEMLGFY